MSRVKLVATKLITITTGEPDSLESRSSLRRGRRNRKTRYRKPRFLNRTRSSGWLPPSLESRIANIETWVRRIRKVCPVTAISQELVRFDLQLPTQKFDVHPKYLRTIHKADGYEYQS